MDFCGVKERMKIATPILENPSDKRNNIVAAYWPFKLADIWYSFKELDGFPYPFTVCSDTAMDWATQNIYTQVSYNSSDEGSKGNQLKK